MLQNKNQIEDSQSLSSSRRALNERKLRIKPKNIKQKKNFEVLQQSLKESLEKIEQKFETSLMNM